MDRATRMATASTWATATLAILALFAGGCASTGLSMKWGEGSLSNVTFHGVEQAERALAGQVDDQALTCWLATAGGKEGTFAGSFGAMSFREAQYWLRFCVQTKHLREVRKGGSARSVPARLELFGLENFGSTLQELTSPCTPRGEKLGIMKPDAVSSHEAKLTREGDTVRVQFASNVGVVVEVSTPETREPLGSFWEEREIEGSYIVVGYPKVTDRTGLACTELYPEPAWEGGAARPVQVAAVGDPRGGVTSEPSVTIEEVPEPEIPTTPAMATTPASGDRDGDGITDVNDTCPDIPEDLDGNADSDGCPEKETMDADGDGIIDSLDPCPNAAEDSDGYRDEDGCPDVDDDMDGVLDTADRCRRRAGPARNGGCPQREGDKDGDGVGDSKDKCPDLMGTGDGCPENVYVARKGAKLILKQPLKFKGRTAIVVGRTSGDILDQLADIMRANPDLRIVIEAHTDNKGTPEKNLTLSERRAQVVRGALVRRGVPPGRMEAIGYGGTRPAFPNLTRRGREMNWRVEIRVVGG